MRSSISAWVNSPIASVLQKRSSDQQRGRGDRGSSKGQGGWAGRAPAAGHLRESCLGRGGTEECLRWGQCPREGTAGDARLCSAAGGAGLGRGRRKGRRRPSRAAPGRGVLGAGQPAAGTRCRCGTAGAGGPASGAG